MGLQPPMGTQNIDPGASVRHAAEQHWLGPLHGSPNGSQPPTALHTETPLPFGSHRLPQQSPLLLQTLFSARQPRSVRPHVPSALTTPLQHTLPPMRVSPGCRHSVLLTQVPGESPCGVPPVPEVNPPTEDPGRRPSHRLPQRRLPSPPSCPPSPPLWSRRSRPTPHSRQAQRPRRPRCPLRRSSRTRRLGGVAAASHAGSNACECTASTDPPDGVTVSVAALAPIGAVGTKLQTLYEDRTARTILAAVARTAVGARDTRREHAARPRRVRGRRSALAPDRLGRPARRSGARTRPDPSRAHPERSIRGGVRPGCRIRPDFCRADVP
jgi:hypothetical protein